MVLNRVKYLKYRREKVGSKILEIIKMNEIATKRVNPRVPGAHIKVTGLSMFDLLVDTSD